MKAWLAVLALCAASLAPGLARAQALVDSLALARQYTTWLYAGEADSLVAHSTDETRNDEGARDRYVQLSQLIAQRAGFELEVSEETWKLRNGECQYWRTAQFSAMEEPLLIRWVLDRQGRIAGIGAGPYAEAPPVESETCAPPAG
ncbi:MAG TPA: hypothetical protein VFH11_02140 [Gemmatimonadota bacterium]|nr:hypothetical protein [Gemmatimonadota bacterium]